MAKKSIDLISASFKGPIPGGMVSAPQSIAVEEGAKVLQNRGNAMDAAVTTAFVQGVVDRTNCGVGGFGMMNVYIAETGEETMLDFHGKAGSKVVPDMWEDIIIQENPSGYGYTVKGSVNEKGYTSITTPGAVSGLHEGLTRYGTISWAEAIQPALELARDGFEVSQATANTWTSAPEGQTSPWAKVKDVPEIGGAVIANKDLAETLRKLSEGGPDVFYRGEIAERTAADIEANGGFVTLKDLNDYRTTISKPLEIDYRGYTIATNAPPGGGLTIIQALNILEEYDLAGIGHNSAEYIYIVSMAMKAAFADWATYLGDRAFVDIPMEWLMSKERAYEWKKKIDRGEPITIPRWRPKESPDTTHVSVMDSAGNAVSLTHSLGASSGMVTPGLGFYYNNCMNCFNPIPGKPNSILPGKSRLTGMSPTIVKKDDKPFFVVGSPGGTRIITGNLQSILNVIDHKMSATEAVSATRFDSQTDAIEAQARIPLSVLEQVKAKGHKIRRTFSSFGGVALVHGILVNREKGILEGGADPAGAGMALYVKNET
ncbi:TPA: gamma-glutamyltransferase [Candidatus Poribacteria bacterium]|nr:gamma-glutamyltransferase [Candidatus Poribacteria bacterium]